MTAAPHPLLDTLRALETELHHPGTTHAPARLEQLLHADFHEIGRSGLRYDRATMLGYLSTPRPPAYTVESTDWAVVALGETQALLTYRSRHRLPDGGLAHAAQRSSVWLRTALGWQMRYHQGTPDPDPGWTTARSGA